MSARQNPRVVVLIDTATGWGRAIIRGIASYNQQIGHWHMWVEPHGPTERLRPPPSWRGEGIIARVSTPAMARQLGTYGVPVVNVSGIPLRGVNFPRVTNDVVAAAGLAAQALFDRGFRNFAYVGWTKFQHVEKHYRAFARQLEERGVKTLCPHFLLGVHSSTATGWRKQQASLSKFLLQLPKPVAVLAWAQQGLAVLNACSWAGLSVPDQVAVLCGDDDETLYAACTPQLSGVAQSTEQVGRTAAEMLNRLMRDTSPDVPNETLIRPTHINERVSTDTLAVNDAEVADAVRFIRAHFDDPIQVDDVANHLALSRRSLERRFLATLGHSPADELRRCRTQRALSLLASSKLPIPFVAQKSGFGSGVYLAHVIKQETGMTPLKYRNTVGKA